MTTRAEAKQVTRGELVAAAIDEFSTKGLDASLDAICARAGLTRGAFYVHFADREQLIVAVMRHALGGWIAVLTGARAEAGGVERAIDVFVAAARARSPVVHAGGALRFHHVMEACRRSADVGDEYRRLVLDARDRLAGGIAHDQPLKRLRADVKPPALADLLVVIGLGIAATLELDIPLDLARLGATLHVVVRS